MCLLFKPPQGGPWPRLPTIPSGPSLHHCASVSQSLSVRGGVKLRSSLNPVEWCYWENHVNNSELSPLFCSHNLGLCLNTFVKRAELLPACLSFFLSHTHKQVRFKSPAYPSGLMVNHKSTVFVFVCRWHWERCLKPSWWWGACLSTAPSSEDTTRTCIPRTAR